MMPRRRAVRLPKTALMAVLLMLLAGCHRKPPEPLTTMARADGDHEVAAIRVSRPHVAAPLTIPTRMLPFRRACQVVSFSDSLHRC